jgi:hypothetical protein
MYHGRLSETEKRQNRRERIRRNRQRKKEQARENVLLGLRHPSLIQYALEPGAACRYLLAQPSLKDARALVNQLNRLDYAHNLRRADWRTGPKIPRPIRVLWQQNCGPVPAIVTAPQIGVTDFLGAEPAVRVAQELVRSHAPALVLLFLCKPEAIGLEPKRSALVAQQFGLNFAPRDIQLAESTINFDNRLQRGCANYNGLVNAGEIKRATGNWSFFQDAELYLLLTGIKIPHTLRRREFLLRIVRTESGKLLCLDLHSASYLPLCRHPVGSVN